MKKHKGVPYCISFDTVEMPGKVVAVSVALDTIILGPNDSAMINLCEHPLYPKLEKYVKQNPSRKEENG
jgi:hypothetical protein